MNYVIEEFGIKRIAYMRRVGPYGPENYQIMQKLKQWATKKDIFSGCTIYGIAQDGPNIPPEKCRYDVCLVIDDEKVLDSEVIDGYLPIGKYAVFTIIHTAEAVQYFWQEVTKIVKENNLHCDLSKPILERYQESLVRDGKCEFCIPLIK